MRTSGLFALFAFAALWAGSTAHAYSLSPLVVELEPSGPKATQTVRVVNNARNSVTVEVTAYAFEFTAGGEEIRTIADDDFLIFPPQAAVDGNSAQAFRVRYIGDASAKTTRAYRIHVKQLPIQVDREVDGVNLGVQMTTDFWGLALVKPEGAAPDARVKSVARADDGRWVLTIVNRGTDAARVHKGRWKFSSPEKSTVLLAEEIGKVEGVPLFLPGDERTITIAPPEGFTDPAATQIEIALTERQRNALGGDK